MSGRIGIELGPDRVRAVRLASWGTRASATFDAPWNPAHPAAAVSLLRDRFGPSPRIGLAVGLGFLHVAHVKLPPVATPEKMRMLALEPDRFFPVQSDATAVSLADECDHAFAIAEDRLTRWVDAFEQWGQVDRVEAAPVSIGRALGAEASGRYSVEAGPGEEGIVDLQRGRVRSVRRRSSDAEGDASKLPDAGVPAAFLAALGAARGLDADPVTMLATERLRAAVRGRRHRRVVVAGAACVAALAFVLWAGDRSRERVRDELDQQIAQLRLRAAPALALQERLGALDRERATIVDVLRRRPETLGVLAALSSKLPKGVTVQKLEVNGDEWRIDGTAADAAALVPMLDQDARFEGVRFLSASTRYRDGNRTYETFSIALRVRPKA